MGRRLQAVYKHGALYPLEPLQLQDMQEVTLTITDTSAIDEDLAGYFTAEEWLEAETDTATQSKLVHKDLRLQFDANKYCVPHRYVGKRLTVKADASAVTIYERVSEVVSYPRSWRRGQTFGAQRFEKLLAEQRPAARRSQAQQRLIDSLDGLCSRELLEGDNDKFLLQTA